MNLPEHNLMKESKHQTELASVVVLLLKAISLKFIIIDKLSIMMIIKLKIKSFRGKWCYE